MSHDISRYANVLRVLRLRVLRLTRLGTTTLRAGPVKRSLHTVRADAARVRGMGRLAKAVPQLLEEVPPTSVDNCHTHSTLGSQSVLLPCKNSASRDGIPRIGGGARP